MDEWLRGQAFAAIGLSGKGIPPVFKFGFEAHTEHVEQV
jgi:hypothetical protein